METGKVGVAKLAIRNREYLTAIKPDGLFIMLEMMHLAQKVPEPEGLKAPAGVALSAKEVQMAKALIDSLTGAFLPEKYADTYRDALRGMIDRKVKHLPPSKLGAKTRQSGPVIDLMPVL